MVAILDELNHVADHVAGATLVKTNSEQMIEEVNWIDRLLPAPRPRTFLSLAVKLDILSYVDAKVRPRCLVQRDSCVWSLLDDAVAANKELNDFFDRHKAFPSNAMFALLFAHGADPNRKDSSGQTPWQRLIQLLMERSLHSRFALGLLEHRRDTHNFNDLVKLFLKHGASSDLLPERFAEFTGIDTAVSPLHTANVTGYWSGGWTLPWRRRSSPISTR